ncbi:hypothetical protein Hdeb2414_s0001g00005521 [Helianthus debilis subsp. tardiflorus]
MQREIQRLIKMLNICGLRWLVLLISHWCKFWLGTSTAKGGCFLLLSLNICFYVLSFLMFLILCNNATNDLCSYFLCY